jgi:acetylornithine/N-succinyldiaminopimelate aminotransferase
MDCLIEHPVLGHITTFGGHPVCCAAGKAAFEVLLEENLVAQVHEKEQAFRSGLQHPLLKAIRSRGLMMALEFESEKICRAVIADALQAGLFTDWFLFAPHCLRIAPPLTITMEEIEVACTLLRKVMDRYK